jgi:hypothetical protein
MPATTTNPADTIATLDERIAATPDPQHRRMLDLARERLVAEMIGDLPRLLGAIGPDFTMVRRPAGQPSGESDAAEFKAGVEQLCASDMMIWVDWEHVALDGDLFMADGVIHTLMPADAAGVTLDAGDDPGTKVVVSTRGVVIIEHADGLQSKEIFYSDPAAAEITKLAPGDAPTRAAAAEALGVPLT